MSDAATPGAPGSVSVTLVTWNGLRWLPGCLASLRAQTVRPLELLVLDNGSTDGTAAWLRDALAGDPDARLVLLDHNTGYAAGHDRLLALARGEHVLLLNQDVELDAGFLDAAVRALAADPRVGAVQGLVLRLDAPGVRRAIVDTTGLVIGRDRRVTSRDQGASATGPASPRARPSGPVWGCDGPAPVLRLAALRTARLPRRGGGREILDSDFFAYKEDVDLAWRLDRLGWVAHHAPDAIAWHARGASAAASGGLLATWRHRRTVPLRARRLGWRNHQLLLVKNEPLGGFVRDLPWIARRQVGSLAWQLLLDPAVLGVVPDLVRALPAAMRKRRALAAAVARRTQARRS